MRRAVVRRHPSGMSRKRALEVLIHHAARNVAGVGCGIREKLTEGQRYEVSLAIWRLWREAHDYGPYASDFRNLGATPPETLMDHA